jgi:hypothetical protein
MRMMAMESDAVPGGTLAVGEIKIVSKCICHFYFRIKIRYHTNKKTTQLSGFFWWGEQDSNLRSFHSRFTVCPRWPLEYLPDTLHYCLNGCKYRIVFEVYKHFL